MDIQKVHEYIWDQVIKDLSAGRHRYCIDASKRHAIMQLMYDGDITKEEEYELHRHAECALCYEYKNACTDCPLYQLSGSLRCSEKSSYWELVNDNELPLQERIEIAYMIRDVFHEEAEE